MTPQERQFVGRLCESRAGLEVDPTKSYLLESRLAPVARREGFVSASELVSALSADKPEERLVWAVVEAMAAGESVFFRDRAPFDWFRDEILPALARRRTDRPLRIWSAGCGAGQEVYSLAICVEEKRAALGGAKVELFASDLSARALEKAQAGLYTQFEIQRGLPVRRLIRNFEKLDEAWAISPNIRQMVRWRRVNLAVEFAQSGQFDIIFCRYVLGSMTPEARTRVAANLAGALAPDGVLFLGDGETAGERLSPLADRQGLFVRRPAARAAA